MPATDGTLVLGARDGDRGAFAELYDRRARLIRAICYDQTRDLPAAADLTQEVFLRAYRSLSALREPDRFAEWLVGIARHVCREWRRARRRERRGLDRLTARDRSSDRGVESIEHRLVELRDEVASVMNAAGPGGASLTSRERLALHVYYLQERNVEDARHVLGLSRSGFYRVLSSACERLRRAHRKRGVHP